MTPRPQSLIIILTNQYPFLQSYSLYSPIYSYGLTFYISLAELSSSQKLNCSSCTGTSALLAHLISLSLTTHPSHSLTPPLAAHTLYLHLIPTAPTNFLAFTFLPPFLCANSTQFFTRKHTRSPMLYLAALLLVENPILPTSLSSYLRSPTFYLSLHSPRHNVNPSNPSPSPFSSKNLAFLPQ